jgi:hypothetical protein
MKLHHPGGVVVCSTVAGVLNGVFRRRVVLARAYRKDVIGVYSLSLKGGKACGRQGQWLVLGVL